MNLSVQKGFAPVLTLVLILLGIVVGVYLVQNYTNFLPHASNPDEARIDLIPGTASYNKGCEFSIDINMNAGNSDTNGTDAVLLYDPTVLTVTTIQNGTIYPNYPGNLIDNTSGKTAVTGLASPSSSFNGVGKLATVNFKINPATTVNSTQIRLDFDPTNPTKTTDSNIVENGTVTDVLTGVGNSQITIGTGSCNGEPTPAPSSSNTPTPTPAPSNAPVALTAKIDPQNSRKVIVSWSGVINGTAFDKIDFFYTPEGSSQRTLISGVYAATCQSSVPNNNSPKPNGSCTFSLPSNKGKYDFKYELNIVTSNGLTVPVSTPTPSVTLRPSNTPTPKPSQKPTPTPKPSPDNNSG